MSDQGLGKFMRGQLAAAGIFLDDEKPMVVASAPVVEVKPEPDRAFTREALEQSGAAARDLEWLIASCPDELAAVQYKPPREAWCLRCEGVQRVGDFGCIECLITKSRQT